jgi:transcriptional regulator with XRE-family HTH domain
MFEIGTTIRIIRQAKRISLGDLAKRAKVSIAFLSLLEHGRREPSLLVLRRLAKALEIPSEVLIILSQPRGGTLEAQGAESKRLTRSIVKLMDAENALRKSLQRKGTRRATKRIDDH